MAHRAHRAFALVLSAVLPLSACADTTATAQQADGEPGPQELIEAMQADFIADLSRSFGPSVGEANAKGEPHFEVLSFEQASVEPLPDRCWRYSGAVTTIMRGVIPIPSEDTSNGDFTVCRQDGALVVTHKEMKR